MSWGRVSVEPLILDRGQHVAAADSGTTPLALDLSRKAARLLAENAALVLAHVADGADIENLP